MRREWHEDSEPDFPVLGGRTLLFNLEPIGLGTGACESLTSYLVRLASVHSLPLRRFVSRLLPSQAPGVLPQCDAKFFRVHAATINGPGSYAQRFVDVLGTATGRRDLSLLTLLPWRNLLAPNGTPLIRKWRQWCPECLADWTGTSAVDGAWGYWPLVWSIVSSTVCTKHGTGLVDACWKCQRRQPAIPRVADLLRCDGCGSDLRVRTHASPASLVDLRSASTVTEQLVALNGVVDPEKAHRRWVKAISVRLASLRLNRASACRLVGLDQRVMNAWVNRRTRVSISAFVRVSIGLDLSIPLAFGRSTAQEGQAIRLQELPPRLATSKPRRHPVDAKERGARLLTSAISAPVAPTLRQIAVATGTSTGFLRYRYPDLVKQLRTRNLEQLRRAKTTRELLHENHVVSAVRSLRAAGMHPSRKRVEAAVRAEGCSLITPRNLAAYRRTVRENLD
jgi:hypothetical protein